MNLADAIFLFFAGVVLVGAFLAVTLRNVFYNALSLILSLFGVAALFIYLNSEFLAIMEVIIYIGAIAIAIIFAIMLSQPMHRDDKPQGRKVFRGAVIASLVFIGLWQTLRRSDWPWADVEGNYSIYAIGQSLLEKNVLPFEVVSLVLLIAIIGALVISSERGRG